MRIVRFFSVLLILATGKAGFAQSTRKEKPGQSNLQVCLRGLPGCEFSALLPNELRLVSEASRGRNYAACTQGLRVCDPARLSVDEAKAVAASAHRRNFEKCLSGSALCIPMTLNTKEARAIIAFGRILRRGRFRCLLEISFGCVLFESHSCRHYRNESAWVNLKEPSPP